MPSLTLSASDLKEILSFTTTLARSAGDLILTGSEAILSSGHVDEKKNSVDLVTEYDVKVEELVKGELSKKYAGFKLCVPVFTRACGDCGRIYSVALPVRVDTGLPGTRTKPFAIISGMTMVTIS